MRIEATKQATNRRLDMTAPVESRQDPVNQESGTQESGTAVEPGRAVVLAAPQQEAAPASGYRQATFLAHLIATRDQVPQTREKRRVEPREAIAAYKAMSALIRG